jgi:hypothetical protein
VPVAFRFFLGCILPMYKMEKKCQIFESKMFLYVVEGGRNKKKGKSEVFCRRGKNENRTGMT